MNKTQKMKQATRDARKKNAKQFLKKIVALPGRAWRAVWNWLKSIDVIGMVNLTLLVVIIVLFVSLIFDFFRCNKCEKTNRGLVEQNVVVTKSGVKNESPRNVAQRRFSTNLPIKVNTKNNITPKIKAVGVQKPMIVREVSLSQQELPKQKLGGDVIVDVTPNSPVLYNGVNINGNLFLQNMRKFTLPCGAKINGHLFIRNVDKLYFCGEFSVKGNIYVNRQSAFGPIPSSARIGGNIIL